MDAENSLKDEIKRAVDESLKSNHKADIVEKRKFPRSRVVWQAELIGHQQTVSGIVQDMSVNGAKMDVKEPFYESKDLSLIIERFGKLNCTVVWRHNGILGLRFEDTPSQIHNLIGSVLPHTGDYDG
jgi:PilZ domain-containing protein